MHQIGKNCNILHAIHTSLLISYKYGKNKNYFSTEFYGVEDLHIRTRIAICSFHLSAKTSSVNLLDDALARNLTARGFGIDSALLYASANSFVVVAWYPVQKMSVSSNLNRKPHHL